MDDDMKPFGVWRSRDTDGGGGIMGGCMVLASGLLYIHFFLKMYSFFLNSRCSHENTFVKIIY